MGYMTICAYYTYSIWCVVNKVSSRSNNRRKYRPGVNTFPPR